MSYQKDYTTTTFKNQTLRRLIMEDIVQLVVQFERDWESRFYPCLGQGSFWGVESDLALNGCKCKKIPELMPLGGSPEGQIRLQGILEGDGSAVERFDELLRWSPPPCWFPAQYGWKTARCWQAALSSVRAECAVVEAFYAALKLEVDDWMKVMEAACEANIRFNLDLVPFDNPQPAQVGWVRHKLECLAELFEDFF
jgi:hypothetical protein